MESSERMMNLSRGVRPPAPEEGPALGLFQTELMERVVESDNVRRAYAKVKANRGAAGVDGIGVEQLAAYAREHWDRIRRELLEGRYEPLPVRRKAIPKPGGGERLLGIPTVMDRLIQQSLLQVLGPMLDPLFSESSFGFRPGRSAHGAVKQIQRYISKGYKMAVDLDLARFFDRVHHDLLMTRLARRVRDKRVLALVGRFLRAGVLVDGDFEPTEAGVPQGGPLSPLLANVLLDDFDKELERRGLRFARYADDALIVVRSKRAAQRVMASLVRWLRKSLRLEVNAEKSRVARTSGCCFLGFTFHGRKVWIDPKRLQRFKSRVRELTSRTRGISMPRRIRELGSYLRGWAAYFALSETETLMGHFDEWIRRRLRMCYWKQWKRPRTRIRNLLALGAPRDRALPAALSSKGPWRLSKSLATHMGMTIEWFHRQGLVSIWSIWNTLAPLRRTA